MNKNTELVAFNLTSIFVAIANLIFMFFGGFKHVASSYYYDSSSGYISDEDFRYPCYQCIFGGPGYSYGPDVKPSAPMIIGFIAMIIFIIIASISAIKDGKGESVKGLYIAQIAVAGFALFLLSPIFSGIAVANYNASVGSHSQYGQNFDVRLGFGFILIFLDLAAVLAMRIIALVKARDEFF